MNVDERIRSGLDQLAAAIEPETDPEDVVDRLRSHRVASAPGGRSRSRRSVWLVAAAAAVVVGVLGVLVARQDGGVQVDQIGSEPSTVAPDARSTTVDPSTAAVWRPLPTGPFQELMPQVIVEGGGQVFVWRGTGVDIEDPRTTRSSSYDLATETWTELPPDPLGGTEGPLVTGVGVGGAFIAGEAIFWSDVGMVAWNPQTATWRSVPEPPRPHRHRAVTVTNGGVTEVVFPLDGVAYDPAADSWRETALPSDQLVGALAADARGMVAATDSIVVVGATAGIYDVAANAWTELPAPTGLEPTSTAWDGFQTSTAFVVDGQVAVVDSPGHTAILDPAGPSWHEAPELRLPMPTCEGSPTVLTLDTGALVASGCGGPVVRAVDGTWSSIPTPPRGVLVPTPIGLLNYGTGYDGPAFTIFDGPLGIGGASRSDGEWTVPLGWKVLDYAEVRFAVPQSWVVAGTARCFGGDASTGGVVYVPSASATDCTQGTPTPQAPSVVRISEDAGAAVGTRTRIGTLDATLLDPSLCETCPPTFQLDSGLRIFVTGPDADAVLATFTDSGAAQALADGPLADRTGWQTVTFEGVTAEVPPTWPVVDLPASVVRTTGPNGEERSTGRQNPGICNSNLFGQTGEAFLGVSSLISLCPYFDQLAIEPGVGLWFYGVDTNTVLTAPTEPYAGEAGLPVKVVVAPAEYDVRQPIVDVLIDGPDGLVRLQIGSRTDPATIRSILASVRPAG